MVLFMCIAFMLCLYYTLQLQPPGQFWNVPVTVEEFTGEFGDEQRDDDYIITVRYPGAPPRSFVGIESSVTWELERRPCYFVGSVQAGPLAEVSEPNDSVIEGVYGDYIIESLFATSYTYSHFLEGRCT